MANTPHPPLSTSTTAAVTPSSPLYASDGVLILDGALATELERHAPRLTTPLWSAHTLLTDPSLIQRVHAAYFSAGAAVAITASYQASVRGLRLHAPALGVPRMDEADARDVVARSVRVAVAARDEAVTLGADARALLVAGSVGPFGAFLADGSEYTGAYGVRFGGVGDAYATAATFYEDMLEFHRGRVAALLDAGADLLAVETQPCCAEVAAVCALLRDEFPAAKAWVSCTVREDGGNEGAAVMSDGTSLRALCELVEGYEQVVAVGVNCCPKGLVTTALREMRRWTGKPLVAYPNSGEVWDAESKSWGEREATEKTWAEYVAEWKAEGARFIGGCCRTTPDDIRVIGQSCKSL